MKGSNNSFRAINKIKNIENQQEDDGKKDNEENVLKKTFPELWLNNHPEVIAEAYQTILRREGIKMPYEQLMNLTRGKKVTLGDMHAFVDSLDIKDEVKEELKRVTPENYTGLAELLVEENL